MGASAPTPAAEPPATTDLVKSFFGLGQTTPPSGAAGCSSSGGVKNKQRVTCAKTEAPELTPRTKASLFGGEELATLDDRMTNMDMRMTRKGAGPRPRARPAGQGVQGLPRLVASFFKFGAEY